MESQSLKLKVMDSAAELFVGVIKQEPERLCVVILPANKEPPEKQHQLRELSICLEKFDRKCAFCDLKFSNFKRRMKHESHDHRCDTNIHTRTRAAPSDSR